MDASTQQGLVLLCAFIVTENGNSFVFREMGEVEDRRDDNFGPVFGVMSTWSRRVSYLAQDLDATNRDQIGSTSLGDAARERFALLSL